MGRTLINEEEKKRILGMHKSYGYTISEQGESIKQMMSSDSMDYDSFNKPGKPTEAEDDQLRGEVYKVMIGVGSKFIEFFADKMYELQGAYDRKDDPKYIQEKLNQFWNDSRLDNFFKDNGFKSGYTDATFDKDATDYISRYNQLKANPSLWVKTL